MEWAKKFLFQRFRQTNFSGKAIAEIYCHACTIHPLWCRRQSKKDSWTEALEYRPVTCGRAMMDFIHNDEVVELTADLLPQTPSAEHVPRAEEMVVASRNVRTHQKFTEVGNTKHRPECADRLFENFL